MRLKNWPLIGLIALALVTCLLVVLAFRHVRPIDGPATAVPAGETTDASDASTSPGADGATNPSQSPSASTSSPPSGSASATPGAGGLAAAQAALNGSQPVRILVLGDGSGDAGDEWVSLWARDLAADHTVAYAGWNSSTQGFDPAKRQGNGPEISLFNASHDDATVAEAARDLDQIRRGASGSATPTLSADPTEIVVISFGYQESPGKFAQDLQKLAGQLDSGTPVLVVNQAPQKGAQANVQRQRARAATDWADKNNYGAVDVFAAFIAAPEPLAQLLDSQGALPNARGQQVWADAVASRLAAA